MESHIFDKNELIMLAWNSNFTSLATKTFFVSAPKSHGITTLVLISSKGGSSQIYAYASKGLVKL